MWINHVNKYYIWYFDVDNLWKMGITLFTVLTMAVDSRNLSTFYKQVVQRISTAY